MDHRRALACLLLLPAMGCVRRLPAPAAPQAIVPQLRLPEQPPPQGTGRVIVDVTDGPAVVERTMGRAVAAGYDVRSYRLLCQTTPCFADLEFGTHEMRLTLRSDEAQVGFATVTISDVATVVRTDVGGIRPGGPVRVIGGILTALGVLGALVGVAPAIIEDSRDWGLPLLIGSGASFLVGVVLVVLDPPTIQDDATTTFELPRAPPVPAPEPGPVPQRI